MQNSGRSHELLDSRQGVPAGFSYTDGETDRVRERVKWCVCVWGGGSFCVSATLLSLFMSSKLSAHFRPSLTFVSAFPVTSGCT